MYVDETIDGFVNLMEMNKQEAKELMEMIGGAGLLHRRTFNNIHNELLALIN